jgi:SAM-dependent methyltransferase
VNYDAELVRYGPALHRAWAVQSGDHVLDVGCGTGQTTRDVARLARSALGVDVSANAIEKANALGNATFACADAQTCRFEPGSFDLAISRFGTMFFDDPVVAFRNIARALREGGRLVMLVWQAYYDNEWAVAVHEALGRLDPDPTPFSLADPATVRRILRAAGFVDIELNDVREPICFGPDTDAALEWVRGFTATSAFLTSLGKAGADRAIERLRDMLAAHQTADGVWLNSRAWIVTARRPRQSPPE